MLLRNKNILLISPEPWDHIFVSKHHFATHLGQRGNIVYFLNPPDTQRAIIKTTFRNVFSVSYHGFTKGLRFLPSIVQKKIIRKVYNQLEDLCQVKFDIIWAFDNSVFYDFSALPEQVVKISHIVDLNQDFQTAKAATTADICLGVIPKLVERLHQYNGNSYLIKHGVQEFSPNIKKVKLPGSGEVKAMYIGNMAMRFVDWELLYQLAKDNNAVDFIFVGPNHDSPDGSSKTKVKGLENVFFLQPVAAIEIHKYLTSADILLLTYLPEYFDNYAFPHKVMEYFASGKTIYAPFAPKDEFYYNRNLMATCKEGHDFPVLFKQVLNNLERWNSEENQKARKAFAYANTYEKQIERIERLFTQKKLSGQQNNSSYGRGDVAYN